MAQKKGLTNKTKLTASGGYKTVGKSLTIPGETYPLKDVLAKMETGQDLRYLTRFGSYDPDDVTFNDLVLSSGFNDLTEVDRLVERQTQIVEDINKAIEVKNAVEAKETKDGDPTPPEGLKAEPTPDQPA